MTFGMPTNTDQIFVQWEGRPESSTACAARMVRMIEIFGRCHPGLDRWREGGWGPREAAIPFSSLPPRLEQMTRRMENARCRGVEGQPLLSPVFLLHAYNDVLGPDIQLSASVGSPASVAFDLPNRIDLTVQQMPDDDRDPLPTALLKAILLAFIEAWEPATGCIRPPALVRRRDWRPYRIEAGWITYLAPPLARRITPPAAAIVEPTSNGGLLLLATEDRFDPENPRHLATWREIQASLAPLETMAWPPEIYLRDGSPAAAPESAP